MKKLTAIVLGYGMRGSTYARYAVEHPDQLEIVGVAEPLDNRRLYAKERHGLDDSMLFNSWTEVAARPKMADFVVISMQDNMHYEPAMRMIDLGYDILLEKPMAPSAKECKDICVAAEKKGVKVIVCHVLRFTQFFCAIKDIIDEGILGDIMSVVHLENVGNTHQSHSFVRGNWRNTAESSPMILAKSCHDTDIIQWLIGKECKKVQSFGSLTHFTEANRPAGAPDYCVDGCPHGSTCPYNAVKLYYDDKNNSWFRSVAANTSVNPTDEQVMEAITRGPYGRCVYHCDNDVVDHQVVNMEFEGGCTVMFSMNCFNEGGRSIRIFGTKGELRAAMRSKKIEVFTFEDRQTREYEVSKAGNTILSGHGGGDTGIMVDLMKYFGGETPSKSVCSIRTSYLNHLIAFAAEESRLNDVVVDMDRFAEQL